MIKNLDLWYLWTSILRNWPRISSYFPFISQYKWNSDNKLCLNSNGEHTRKRKYVINSAISTEYLSYCILAQAWACSINVCSEMISNEQTFTVYFGSSFCCHSSWFWLLSHKYAFAIKQIANPNKWEYLFLNHCYFVWWNDSSFFIIACSWI